MGVSHNNIAYIISHRYILYPEAKSPGSFSKLDIDPTILRQIVSVIDVDSHLLAGYEL